MASFRESFRASRVARVIWAFSPYGRWLVRLGLLHNPLSVGDRSWLIWGGWPWLRPPFYRFPYAFRPSRQGDAGLETDKREFLGVFCRSEASLSLS